VVSPTNVTKAQKDLIEMKYALEKMT